METLENKTQIAVQDSAAHSPLIPSVWQPQLIITTSGMGREWLAYQIVKGMQGCLVNGTLGWGQDQSSSQLAGQQSTWTSCNVLPYTGRVGQMWLWRMALTQRCLLPQDSFASSNKGEDMEGGGESSPCCLGSQSFWVGCGTVSEEG